MRFGGRLRRADGSGTKITTITKVTKQNRYLGLMIVGVFATFLSAPSARLSRSQSSLPDLAKSRLSQISGDIKVTGLEAPVQVVRDTWGVPHISAQSADDLFFAQGYVMAQDRLWQMDLWRRDR